MARKKKSSPSKLNYPVSQEKFPKIHRWRICPLGQHWVREHPRRVRPSRRHPLGGMTSVAGHCRDNPSHKDQMYSDEIAEIALTKFNSLKGAPKASKLGFPNENEYDSLIRGWTRYPNLIKALIASESSFNPNASNGKRGNKKASGLMQVTHETVDFLKDEEGELTDHLLNIDKEDVADPNLNIAAGVRWLFQKRKLASKKLGREATWEEAVAEYKSYLSQYRKNPNFRGMGTFRKFYQRLKR
ncbi:MAG: transglycosylase SLT domain-containing protein [Pseudomonadota bacterium]